MRHTWPQPSRRNTRLNVDPAILLLMESAWRLRNDMLVWRHCSAAKGWGLGQSARSGARAVGGRGGGRRTVVRGREEKSAQCDQWGVGAGAGAGAGAGTTAAVREFLSLKLDAAPPSGLPISPTRPGAGDSAVQERRDARRISTSSNSGMMWDVGWWGRDIQLASRSRPTEAHRPGLQRASQDRTDASFDRVSLAQQIFHRAP
jgi:hypothetical protein